MGDVAAAYLTATDMRYRLGYNGQVTFVVDKAAIGILEGMMGVSIFNGEIIDNFFRFYEVGALPINFPPADLYLHLASPSGDERFAKDYSSRSDVEGATAGKDLGIPIDPKTVRITHTVLGNTENTNSKNPYAGLFLGPREFDLSAAGIGPNENGIYRDFVAASTKGKTHAQLLDEIKLYAAQIPDPSVGEKVLQVLDNKVLVGPRVISLAYGISSGAVKRQANDYFKGLATWARENKTSVIVFTPSGYKINSNSDLAATVKVVDKTSPLPAKANVGNVYVLKTGTMPHELFVKLMAASQLPPVIAGDGALSAAISIGKPFVMTRSRLE